jgi:hypothetical protein
MCICKAGTLVTSLILGVWKIKGIKGLFGVPPNLPQPA